MIKPENIEREFERKSMEFDALAIVLQRHIDGEELDEEFARFHDEVLSEYDCSQCRNCCKKCAGIFTGGEMGRAAKVLGISKKEFVEKYIDKVDDTFLTKETPCNFFDMENNCCKIEECEPNSCKGYPYTNEKGIIYSLDTIVEAASICPVVFEILERIQEEYTGIKRKPGKKNKKRWREG
ncbi:MAG: YkgJ family cysteine cluster protein [Clostridium sp.]